MNRRRHLLRAAGLVVVTLLAYWNSLDGPFVFDDFPAIRDNATIRALIDPVAAFSPPQASGVGGRPLANFSLALNYAASGASVRGYHLGNLLLHVSSVLLLFGIVGRTAGASRTPLAFMVALIWAVHPITTAAVSYLSQRTELLMGFFYLLTLYTFSRSIESTRSAMWRIVSVAACAAGMMSKESMVTAPVLVALYDRTFVGGTFRVAWTARRSYYVALASTWLVLGYLLTTGLNQRSVGFGLGVSPLDYALTESRAILLYLRLALWPAPLVFDYGRIFAAPAIVTAASVLIVVALVAAIGWSVRRGSKIGFGASCFFLLLAPTSTFVPVAEQPVAENRLYLPLAALVTVGAFAAHAALARKFCLTAVAVGAGALAAMTVARNETYETGAGLWWDTVQKRPDNPRAHFNCGVTLLEAGKPAAAATHFQRAIVLNPHDPKPHNSLGNALLLLDRPADALPHFAAAVALEPAYAMGWYNYGIALFRTHQHAAAITRFEQSLRLEPKDPHVHDALGNVYFQMDRPADAIPHYERALLLDPKLADAHYNCGSACLELNRLADAITHFEAAARLKPTDAEIRNNLGAALLRAGRRAEAIKAFEDALRLKPGYADAADNLNVARTR